MTTTNKVKLDFLYRTDHSDYLDNGVNGILQFSVLMRILLVSDNICRLSQYLPCTSSSNWNLVNDIHMKTYLDAI